MLLLVGNPAAQSGKNRERIARARELIARAGLDVVTFDTLPHGATVAALRAQLDEGAFETVVAMGGDGTFREVAAALATSSKRAVTRMGMLPTGTANDQGRSFGMEARGEALEANVAVLLTGREIALDGGCITARSGSGEALGAATWFFDSAGWGLAARVLERRNRDREIVAKLGPLEHVYRDKAVYAGALLRTLLESAASDDGFAVEGTVDGAPFAFPRLTDLVLKNTRIYAGAWVFDRTSQPDDGAMELVPFFDKADWADKALADHEQSLLDDATLGSLGGARSVLRGASFEMSLTPPARDVSLPAQLDGEEWDSPLRLSCEVVRGAVRLVVPRG